MTPAVNVNELHYHYPNGPAALRRVSFTVQAGECVGLVGPNGAGKSTVLAHLNGLLPDNANAKGQVMIDGEMICKKNLDLIRKKVGLVFQEPDDQLFCPTVFEDIAFGPRQFGLPVDRLENLVRESLARVGLDGFESRAPHHLSGGEKRRVCLAGVLACEPDILLLDEPTSNLDPRGRRQLIELLAGLTITRIIASHDLEMILQLCSRAIVFDGGRVIAQGPTRDLLADADLMRAHGLECPASLARDPVAPEALL
ncbi:MAG TPA: ATP-binding cassette domain-containing protein [Tepidisphaeraceae bacterium]|jgi:cobalt transport protein ATP-binding subunit|nr:ATP-binding cassette domain-containing protein [Tepidisphaeraceae bacterium]